MYLAVLRRGVGSVKFELFAHLCSLVGFVKTKFMFRRGKTRRLEIGAGPAKRRGFVTVDMSLASDYPFDLRVGLPFPDNSFELVYAEHVLEHFHFRDLTNLLQECRRVLMPGGKLSVVVPDVSIYVDAYVKKRGREFTEEYCKYEFGLHYRSSVDFLNYIFYMDGLHRYMFDSDSMVALLTACGFGQATPRAFDCGLDQQARRYESIYFVAQKNT